MELKGIFIKLFFMQLLLNSLNWDFLYLRKNRKMFMIEKLKLASKKEMSQQNYILCNNKAKQNKYSDHKLKKMFRFTLEKSTYIRKLPGVFFVKLVQFSSLFLSHQFLFSLAFLASIHKHHHKFVQKVQHWKWKIIKVI